MTQISLPIAFLLFIGIAFLVPALRLHSATGRWGFTLFDRKAGTSRRILGLLIAMCGVGLLAWTVLYAFIGPEKLSVWQTPGWVSAIGWSCLIAGLIATVTAQAQMGSAWRVGIDETATVLVTHGLFAHSRNPIFSALLLAVLGVLLISPSPWTIVISVSLLLLLHVQTRMEERHLARLHGQQYLAYASSVGRFLPGVGKKKP